MKKEDYAEFSTYLLGKAEDLTVLTAVLMRTTAQAGTLITQKVRVRIPNFSFGVGVYVYTEDA